MVIVDLSPCCRRAVMCGHVYRCVSCGGNGVCVDGVPKLVITVVALSVEKKTNN